MRQLTLRPKADTSSCDFICKCFNGHLQRTGAILHIHRQYPCCVKISHVFSRFIVSVWVWVHIGHGTPMGRGQNNFQESVLSALLRLDLSCCFHQTGNTQANWPVSSFSVRSLVSASHLSVGITDVEDHMLILSGFWEFNFNQACEARQAVLSAESSWVPN